MGTNTQRVRCGDGDQYTESQVRIWEPMHREYQSDKLNKTDRRKGRLESTKTPKTRRRLAKGNRKENSFSGKENNSGIVGTVYC